MFQLLILRLIVIILSIALASDRSVAVHNSSTESVARRKLGESPEQQVENDISSSIIHRLINKGELKPNKPKTNGPPNGSNYEVHLPSNIDLFYNQHRKNVAQAMRLKEMVGQPKQSTKYQQFTLTEPQPQFYHHQAIDLSDENNPSAAQTQALRPFINPVLMPMGGGNTDHISHLNAQSGPSHYPHQYGMNSETDHEQRFEANPFLDTMMVRARDRAREPKPEQSYSQVERPPSYDLHRELMNKKHLGVEQMTANSNGHQHPKKHPQQPAGRPSNYVPAKALQGLQLRGAARHRLNAQQIFGKPPPIQAIPRPSNKVTNANSFTNDQIMSLIDELKDYNSRQATKIEASSRVRPNGKPGPTREDADDEPTKQEEEAEKAEPEGDSGQKSSPKESPDDRVSTEDLAKFARFLMTKEGANMRFQLGLDKDSPDDGDEEDEKDRLLESNKLATKANKGQRQNKNRAVAELDRKTPSMAKKMDKLMGEISDKVRNIEENSKTIGDHVRSEASDSSEPDDARSRRDQQSISGQAVGQGKTDGRHQWVENSDQDQQTNHPSLADGEEDNFARMLIKQELMEDKADANHDPPQIVSENIEGSEDNHDTGLMPMSTSSNIHRRETREMAKEPANHEQGGNHRSGGESNQNYSKHERNKDQLALISELHKVRAAKDKARARMPITVEPLLRRALDGEIGMHTERQPGGKLLLRAGKGNVMTLKLPKRRTTHEATNNDGKQNRLTNDDSSQITGETVPIRAAPEQDSQVIDKVQLQSSKPLKDEYPISDRVSRRLDRLSHNLDRYFNDGFLQAIEAKSDVGADGKKLPSGESHQPQSSNVDESSQHSGQSSASRDRGGTHGKASENRKQADKDFDVDVSIDGKKDEDQDDDDDDVVDADAKRVNGNGTSKNSQTKNQSKSNPRVRSAGVKRIHKQGGRQTTGGEVSSKDAQPDEVVAGNIESDLSAKKEKVEFENSGKLHADPDPVESEALDTPIGPDGDNILPQVDASKQQKTTSTYGKKMTGNFYEEPAWRAK